MGKRMTTLQMPGTKCVLIASLGTLVLACAGRSDQTNKYEVRSSGGSGAVAGGAGGAGGEAPPDGSGTAGESATSAGTGPGGKSGRAGGGAGDQVAGRGGLGAAGAGGRAPTCGDPIDTASVDGDLLYLKASNPDATDAFGTTVALTADWLAVGAPDEDSRSSGIERNRSAR